MPPWSHTELDKIAAADELELASQRADGSLRKPRTIWVVRVGDSLYVRSVRGRGSDWFRGVLTRHVGEIHSGGVQKAVEFVEESDLAIQQQIDEAYRAKYKHYPQEYTDACLTPEARAATLRLEPRA